MNKKLLLVAALCVLTLALVGFSAARATWEYKIIRTTDVDAEKELNRAGSEGWELVNTAEIVAEGSSMPAASFYLKRRR